MCKPVHFKGKRPSKWKGAVLLANAAQTNNYPCANSNFDSYLAVYTGKVTQNKSQII